MIAVDTSALLAIVFDEPQAEACIQILDQETECVISAATVAEALIVADRRGVRAEVAFMIDQLGFEVLDVTKQAAERVAQCYRRWGKGVHPAGLNLGDCFAYEAAQRRGCALLFVGQDFDKTDIENALQRHAGS